MSNKRKEIRHAFRNVLVGKTRAMFSVHTAKTRAIWDEELPAINVWAQDEEPERSGESPIRYKRTLTVTVECYLRSVREIDDEMDDFLSEVEFVLDGQDLFSLSDSVNKIDYAGSHIDYQPETSKEGAVATLTYNVEYFTYAGVDTSFLPPLEGIDAKWDEKDFTVDELNFPNP